MSKPVDVIELAIPFDSVAVHQGSLLEEGGCFYAQTNKADLTRSFIDAFSLYLKVDFCPLNFHFMAIIQSGKFLPHFWVSGITIDLL